jgi:hypothetical protein
VKRGGGHDENNMILKNKVVKRGGQAWRKQYDHKQQGCEKGDMTKKLVNQKNTSASFLIPVILQWCR